MPALAAIGIVTKDMRQAARFYRLLGLEVPEPSDDHNEATLPNGLRLMSDPVEQIKEMQPGFGEPKGYRMALALECTSPAEVDATHKRILAAGMLSQQEP